MTWHDGRSTLPLWIADQVRNDGCPCRVDSCLRGNDGEVRVTRGVGVVRMLVVWFEF